MKNAKITFRTSVVANLCTPGGEEALRKWCEEKQSDAARAASQEG